MEVSYSVGMSDPDSHLFEVTMDIRGHPGPTLELSIPAWIPGSYLLREFAKQIQNFTVRSGSGPLPWQKIEKGTWRIKKGEAADATIQYRVYANDLTVDTSHLDSSHGYFNGPCLFLYVRGHKDLPCRLSITPPAGWKVTTGLKAAPGSPTTYMASNYDELVDCPVEIGNQEVREFAVRGVPFRVAYYGRGNAELERVTKDIKKIVEAHVGFWGDVPFEDYTFIMHLATNRYNGLEHRNSTTCLAPALTFKPQRSYEEFLGLTSHEFFHTWNVKRIRPAGLEPINYAGENYTHHLWLMEGITSYYGQLLLRRGDLLTPKRYLDYLAKRIKKYHETPGRQIQSVEDSSFDTWIKFYRPDENTPNNVISYYLKGELIGLVVDLETRFRSDNRKSFDQFMHHLWAEYGRIGKWIPEENIETLYEQATGVPVGDLLRRYLTTTEEIPFEEHLLKAGLKLVTKKERKDEDEEEEEVPKPGYLGVETIDRGDRVFLRFVLAGLSAAKAGLYADDEVLAINGNRVDAGNFRKIIGTMTEGEKCSMMVARRGEITSRDVVLGQRPSKKYVIERVHDATDQQKAIYADWLRTSWPPGKNGRHANGNNST